jgi:hypothetical protein
MKTLYKFFKTAEVRQERAGEHETKVEKYNLAKKLNGRINYLMKNLKLPSKKSLTFKRSYFSKNPNQLINY